MNRKAELKQPKSIKAIASYIDSNISEEDVTGLARAVLDGDRETQKKILNKNTREGFIPRLNNIVNYDAEMEQVASEVVEVNKSKVKDDLLAQRNFTPRQIQILESYKPPKAETRIIRQKSAKGTYYERASPRKFSKLERGFLVNNQDLSAKEYVTRYNSFFPNRSKSSLISARKRIKAKSKNV